MKKRLRRFVRSLEDKVARSTEWKSASRKSSSFTTRTLIEKSSNRLEFVATTSWLMFSVILLATGLCFLVMGYQVIAPAQGDYFSLPLLIGVFFTAIGIALFVESRRAIVFDRDKKMFWIGREPTSDAKAEVSKNAMHFDEIYAFQLLRNMNRIRGKYSTTYLTYELNLVAQDGSRINVLEHGGGGAELGFFREFDG